MNKEDNYIHEYAKNYICSKICNETGNFNKLYTEFESLFFQFQRQT